MNDLSKIIEQVGKDKGIDRNLLISAIEEAMLMVAKRKYGLSRDIEARYNTDLGEVELFQFMNVVEKVEDSNKELTLEQAVEHDPDVTLGDSIGLNLDTTLLSRIAAQTAKQVIVQKVRDAEREIIFNEFQHRKGEIITGLIRRLDRGNIIIDLGKTEGFMPIREQIPGELYNSGDRIQAYLRDVQLTPKGPRIILSRSCPDYLIALFSQEVPEIREGLVMVKGAAREPGIRAKLAVLSRDPDIDPIGACVGLRGNRVQNIVQELKGERIDIVPWEEDITRYVCNALSPAEIQKVVIDESGKSIEVVVDEENLSLAIGKRGQNVRLASDLTGWRLDIVSVKEMNDKVQRSKKYLMQFAGVDETRAMALYQSGFDKVADVAEASPANFEGIPGFDAEKGEALIAEAKQLLEAGNLEEDKDALEDQQAREAIANSKEPAGDKMSAIDKKLKEEMAASAKEEKKVEAAEATTEKSTTTAAEGEKGQ